MKEGIDKITWFDLAVRYVENVLGKRPPVAKFPIINISPENNLYLEAARLLARRFNAPASYPQRPENNSPKLYDYKSIEELAQFLSHYSLEQIKKLLAELNKNIMEN